MDASRQRILQFTDLSGGAHTYEAGYSSIWGAIGQQIAFDDSCLCEENLDNGLGLNWDVSVPGGDQRSTSSRVAFTPDAGADDSDGDGLKDSWEVNGYDYGGVHVPLNEWGADPGKKDVFLQVNWMSTRWWLQCNWSNFWSGCASRSKDFAPSRSTLAKLRDAFAAQDVNLHIDAGPRSPLNTNGEPFQFPLGGMAVQYRESFAQSSSSEDQGAALDAAHESGLSDARKQSFRLVVIGDHPYGTSNVTGFGYTPGSVFFISGGAVSSDSQLVQTIMHELGHNLGLNHGGPRERAGSKLNCKPNYRSVMNYLFQLRGLGLRYEATSSTNNPAPSQASIQPCINVGGRPYPQAPYNVDADWPDLEFTGGGIGGLSSGSLSDPEIEAEPEYDNLLANGLAAEDGDGGIEIVGPTVLFEGLSGQSATLRVANPGNVDARYEVGMTANSVALAPIEVEVPAHQVQVVTVPLGAISGTTADLVASIRPPGAVEDLSTRLATIPVLPFDRAAAASALDAASTDGALVATDIRDALTSALKRVSAPPPAELRIHSGDQQAVSVGGTFASQLSVKVLDDSGEARPGTEVLFTVESGSASFGGPTTALADSNENGIAVAPSLVAGNVAGPVVVSATAGGASVQFLESVTASGNGKANLKINLSVPQKVRVGTTTSATVIVANSGRRPARMVTTLAALPRWLSVTNQAGQSASCAYLIWKAKSIAPGARLSYRIRFVVTKRVRPTAFLAALTGTKSVEWNYRDNAAAASIRIVR